MDSYFDSLSPEEQERILNSLKSNNNEEEEVVVWEGFNKEDWNRNEFQNSHWEHNIISFDWTVFAVVGMVCLTSLLIASLKRKKAPSD